MSALAEKTIVVTGASSGIGRCLARQLVAAGATVIAIARSAEKLAALQAEAGRRLVSVVTDVSAADAGDTLIAALRSLDRSVDVLVNNAGVGYLEPFLASTPAHWLETVETNLFGALRLTQAFLPAMLERRRGLIVNIGSNGSSGWPYLTLYAASKAALEAATVAIDREHAEYGVRVLCVDVGPTRGTEFGSRFTDAETLSRATATWTRLGIAWNDFVTADETAKRIADAIARNVVAWPGTAP